MNIIFLIFLNSIFTTALQKQHKIFTFFPEDKYNVQFAPIIQFKNFNHVP